MKDDWIADDFTGLAEEIEKLKKENGD